MPIARAYFVFLILFFHLPVLNAQTNSPKYIISHNLISVEEGMASREVFCGVQDSKGFLWFGTRNGLNRYDGKNFKLFTKQSNGLQENKIIQLGVDDADHLFIVYGSVGFERTPIGKIDVLDLNTGEIRPFDKAFPNAPFKEADISRITNDGTNKLSILSERPVNLWYYSSSNGFELRQEFKNWNQNLPGSFTNTFQQGKCFIAPYFNDLSTNYYLTKNKLYKSFTDSGRHQSWPFKLPASNMQDLAVSLQPDAEPQWPYGILSNEGDELISQFSITPFIYANGHGWSFTNSDGDISCMISKPDKGIYQLKNGYLLKLLVPQSINGFENLRIYHSFADKQGNRWLSTSLGLLQFKIEANHFQHYFTKEQQSQEPNNQVRGIYVEDGKIYANIWDNLFVQKDSITKVAPFGAITYAIIKHRGKIYSSYNALIRYNEDENKLLHWPGNEAAGEAWSMYSVSDSIILLGCTAGIFRHNVNTNSYKPCLYIDGGIPQATFVYRIFRSLNNQLWAVAENGLYLLNADGNIINCWAAKDKPAYKKQSVPAYSLLDAYEDSDGIFWLATNGEGLYKWNKNDNNYKQFNITAGFPSDILYRIEPDEKNNLWISTDNGIVRFNRQNSYAYVYKTTQGLSHNEFNRTSSFKSKDGRLFFGGLNGLNAFYPTDFTGDTSETEIPLRIISYTQFSSEENTLVDRTTELDINKKIVIKPGDKFFDIEFLLLDYEKGIHRYAYKIDNFDKDWNYLDENSIRISGLPYGKYILHIKAQTQTGQWSKSELNIPIVVLKPFYLEWWFIFTALASLTLLITLYVRNHTRQLKKDKAYLEQTVSQRTEQLRESLSEKEALLKEIHHRVKNNLEVISSLLMLQTKSITDEKSKAALSEGQSRVQSIALIHHKLYRTDNMATVEMKGFASDLYKQVADVFKKRDDKIIFLASGNEMTVDTDSAVPLGLILNELFTNAFKYAIDPERENIISLELAEFPVANETNCRLIFRDNGSGMPVDFKIEETKSLGMKVMQLLIKQISGNLKYYNDGGAVFEIEFTKRHSTHKKI